MANIAYVCGLTAMQKGAGERGEGEGSSGRGLNQHKQRGGRSYRPPWGVSCPRAVERSGRASPALRFWHGCAYSHAPRHCLVSLTLSFAPASPFLEIS